MTQKVQDIQVINIDNVPYAVDAMSDTAKRLVAVYNDWNQKEADVRDELMMIQAAKETLSRQIIEQVRKEKAEAEEQEKANSAPVVPAVETESVVDPVHKSPPVDPVVESE